MSLADDFAADAGIKTPGTKYQVPAKGAALTEGLQKYNPTADNNFLQNALIGAGKGFYDMGAGLNQLGSEAANYVSPSVVSNQTIAAQRQAQDQRDAIDNPINHTAGGVVGQIGANVATMAVPVGALSKVNLLTKVLNPTTIRGAAALGAGMGAAQGLTRPVGTQDSRLANTATGATAGAIGGGLTGAIAPAVANAASRVGLSAPAAQGAGNLIGNTGSGAIAGATQGALGTPLKPDGSIDWEAMGQNSLTGAIVGGATGAATNAIGAAGAKYAQPVVNRLTQSLGIGAKAPAVPTPTTPAAAANDASQPAPTGNPLIVTPAANDGTMGAKPRVRVYPGTSIDQPQPAQTTPASPQNQAVTAAATPSAPEESPTIPEFTAPDLPEPKSVLSPDQQQANIDTMHAIGLDTQRQSAITGDKFTAGTEYEHSKLNSPMGDTMRGQLDKEQATIKNYATGLVQQTGANAATPEAIGQAIKAPLQGLSDHYDNAVSQLYDQADQRAAGAANVPPASLGQILGTNSLFAGKNENMALRRGIRAYMGEQGITDAQGNLQNMNVQTAEGLRQYLNDQWSPQNSGLIGRIKEALDTDVTQAAGDDIYQQARALHAERKNTLDNPKGISSLLNENGPGGINQQVPDERVGQKLMTMPTAQFGHIVDTLNNLPEQLQPQGQQALAEIKGTIAKSVYQAGDKGGNQNGPSRWNAANVTRELNNQRSKMGLVFGPDEIAQFGTLNDAGHILQTPSAYPGSAAQGHNLVQRGMVNAPAAVGATLGHVIGGVPGAFVGSSIGNSVSAGISRRIDQNMANRLLQQMANPQVTPPQE